MNLEKVQQRRPESISDDGQRPQERRSNFGDLDNDGFLDFHLGTGYPDYEHLMPNVKAWRANAGEVRPMLATLAGEPTESDLANAHLVYEPKYDGIRALVELDPGAPPSRSRGGKARRPVRTAAAPAVRIWSRLGNPKHDQFPELVDAFTRLAPKVAVPLVLDGEIVALDASGAPMGFQALQTRMHLTQVAEAARDQPTAFIAFDLLRDGDEDLRPRSLSERRSRLEAHLRRRRSARIRLSEVTAGDGRRLYVESAEGGGEGLIAKDRRSPYESGRRSQAWRKIKTPRRQEFVIGGWTEPRGTRRHFGALLLGVHEQADGDHLRLVSQVGSGFSQAELDRLAKRLRKLEVKTCPFARRPPGSTRVHWVRPVLVAEVKFTEWTSEGGLRHPTYLGLRDDRDPRTVVRERAAGGRVTSRPTRGSTNDEGTSAGRPRGRRRPRAALRPLDTSPELEGVVAQLQELEDQGRDGPIPLPEGQRLRVTNLRKVFWPASGITKGELLRFYTRVSPTILPVVTDRPLVMKRFPNGIAGQAFYQQRSRDTPPAGVRVEALPGGIDPIGEAGAERLVGGSLVTLLYMAQIAAISQDPWFSRVQSPLDADYAALDLDPMDGVPFAQVLDVARWIRDELDTLGVAGFPKTSGASGLHIFVPLPPGTSYQSGMLFCQIVATIVASRHPRVATVTRAVSARGKTVYIDYLQNILGKPLACAYSARASDFAGVSAPLTWKEIDDGVDPRDFTIRSMPARLAAVGDLWQALRTTPPADLRAALRY